MNKKLQNNQRKWIQIGRLENEIKHRKAYYNIFKEYSQTMPFEDIEIFQRDIEISLREISKELKKYKELRKKLIRQALMLPGEMDTSLEDCDNNDDEIENPTAEDFEAFSKQVKAMLLKDDPNYQPKSTEEYLEELRKAFNE